MNEKENITDNILRVLSKYVESVEYKDILEIKDQLTKYGQAVIEEEQLNWASKINMIALGIHLFQQSEKDRIQEEKKELRRRDGGPTMAAFSLIDKIKKELENLGTIEKSSNKDNQ